MDEKMKLKFIRMKPYVWTASKRHVPHSIGWNFFFSILNWMRNAHRLILRSRKYTKLDRTSSYGWHNVVNISVSEASNATNATIDDGHLASNRGRNHRYELICTIFYKLQRYNEESSLHIFSCWYCKWGMRKNQRQIYTRVLWKLPADEHRERRIFNANRDAAETFFQHRLRHWPVANSHTSCGATASQQRKWLKRRRKSSLSRGRKSYGNDPGSKVILGMVKCSHRQRYIYIISTTTNTDTTAANMSEK